MSELLVKTHRRRLPAAIIGVVIGLAIFHLSLRAGAEPAPPPPSNQQAHDLVLSLVDSGRPFMSYGNYDFGHLAILDPAGVHHTFRMRNDNAVPLTITEMKTTCGCTSALATGKSLPFTVQPGETIDIQVSINTGSLNPGVQHKQVTVSAQNQLTPAAIFTMDGTLEASLGFSPVFLDFGPRHITDRSAKILDFGYNSELALDPKKSHLISNNPDVIIKLKGLDPHSTLANNGWIVQKYELTLRDNVPLGQLRGNITLAPTPNSPHVPITTGSYVLVSGDIDGDIGANMTTVAFGALQVGKTVTQEVLLTGKDADMMDNLKVSAQIKDVVVKVVKTAQQPGTGPVGPNQAVLEVNVTPTKPGDLESEIYIETPEKQKLVLNVMGSVSDPSTATTTN